MKVPVAIALTLLLCASCQDPKRAPPKEVRIGAVLPLTGPAAGYGVSCRSGIDLAIAQANREGGVLGRRVRADFLDSQGRPEDAALAAQRSITRDKVELLIGEVSSDGALAIASVAERAKTPMISPAATTPLLVGASAYAFPITYADPAQAWAMASYARRDLGLTKVAVLRDLSSEYSLRLAQAFRERFVAEGGEVGFEEAIDRVDASVFPVVERLVAAGVQAVYAPLYEEEVQRVVNSVAGMGAKLQFLGSDGWDAAGVLDLGSKVEGSSFTTHFAADEPRPEVQAFVRAFVEVYNERPDATAALGYDAVRFGLLTMAAEGSSDRAPLSRALGATRSFEGVTGAIRFDAERRPHKEVVVVVIRAGERRFVKRVTPEPAAHPGAAP